MQTPDGTQDYLPSDVERYLFIEQTLRRTFKLWGYEEVRTPVIELVDTLSLGVSPEFIDDMFKFQDRNGKILALRAEMTTPIARVATTKMSSKPKPLRLFYVCNVFRFSHSYFENFREFHQAGAELIGCGRPEADGEIISLLLSLTKEIGLSNVRIDVGHIGLLNEIFKAMKLEEPEVEIFQKILRARSNEKILRFTSNFEAACEVKDLLLKFLGCKKLKDLQSIRSELKSTKIQKILSDLQDFSDVLQDYGVERDIFFDFSLARGIGYYTGIVFEASIPSIGVPIGGGGRYDNLLEKFNGVKLPATGFAIEVEKCQKALNKKLEVREKRDLRVLVKAKSRGAGVEVSKLLRQRNIPCLLNFGEPKSEGVVEYAEQHEVSHIIFANFSFEEPVEIYDLERGSTEKLKLQEFIRKLEEDYEKENSCCSAE
ncbi:MAG: ATP phosphoribosyltransferase regulatory subunit [Candidatus Bathyarchaeia archaeon]